MERARKRCASRLTRRASRALLACVHQLRCLAELACRANFSADHRHHAQWCRRRFPGSRIATLSAFSASDLRTALDFFRQLRNVQTITVKYNVSIPEATSHTWLFNACNTRHMTPYRKNRMLRELADKCQPRELPKRSLVVLQIMINAAIARGERGISKEIAEFVKENAE